MSTLVSLPEHLRQTLLALLELPPPPVLTDDLAAQLRPYVVRPARPSSPPASGHTHIPSHEPAAGPEAGAGSKRTIPYSLLSQISRHVRDARCKPALEEHKLDPREYEMLALLAGVQTVTSATADPPKTTDVARKNAARQWAEDRRTLSAVVNGLFSVGGVGFASWYAAGSAGWREEWRVLLALLAGLVVATSEAVLFVIWQDRAEKRKLRAQAQRDEKDRRVRQKARDKSLQYDVDGEPDGEEKRPPRDGQHAPPVSGREVKPEATTVAPAETTPSGEKEEKEEVIILPSSEEGEEHPGLRRRAPPAAVAQNGEGDTE